MILLPRLPWCWDFAVDLSSDNLNPLTDRCICNPSEIRQNSPCKVTGIGSNRQRKTISNDLHTHVPAFKQTCTHMHTHQYTQDCKRIIALLTGNPSVMKQPQSMTFCVLMSLYNHQPRMILDILLRHETPPLEVTPTSLLDFGTSPPFCPVDLPFPGWLMDFTNMRSF